MKENSRIRFNPVTKEIEIEGSELFVKTYFSKLQALISESKNRPMAVKGKPEKIKASPQRKAGKKSTPPGVSPKKKVTHFDKIVSLIKESKEGISTAELKGKTKLAESQIWNIVNRATKEGKIRKIKRGLYTNVAVG